MLLIIIVFDCRESSRQIIFKCSDHPFKQEELLDSGVYINIWLATTASLVGTICSNHVRLTETSLLDQEIKLAMVTRGQSPEKTEDGKLFCFYLIFSLSGLKFLNSCLTWQSTRRNSQWDGCWLFNHIKIALHCCSSTFLYTGTTAVTAMSPQVLGC